MSYLLPGFFQKRLMRYVLSRIGLFDTDQLDLEDLDIAWGQRSIFEFRDLHLQLKKLGSLLHLPPNVQVVRAQVRKVRVTLPADLLNNGLLLEVCGINVLLKELRDDEFDGSRKVNNAKNGFRENAGDAQPRPRRVDKRHERPMERCDFASDELREDFIPDPEDLAHSFLETEPVEEKAELQAALESQSQYLQQSVDLGDNADDELGMGSGSGVSLPSFLAGILKGIMNRIEIRIKNTEVDFDMLMSVNPTNSENDSRLETVTVRFNIESVLVHDSRTQQKGEGDANANDALGLLDANGSSGRRCVSVLGLRCLIVSDSSVLDLFTRSADEPPSSSTSSLSQLSQTGSVHLHSLDQSLSSLPDARSAMARSQSTVISSQQHDPPREVERSLAIGMEASQITSDGDRFADAGSEEDYDSADYSTDYSNISESLNYDDVHESSDDSVCLNRHLENKAAEETTESSHVLPQEAPDRNQTQDNGSGETSSGSLPISIPQRLSSSNVRESRWNDFQQHSELLPKHTFFTQSEHDIVHSQPLPLRRYGSRTDATGTATPRVYASIIDPLDGESRAQSPVDDLAMSKIFSHEEAESMYMSAFSHTSEAGSPNDNFLLDVGSSSPEDHLIIKTPPSSSPPTLEFREIQTESAMVYDYANEQTQTKDEESAPQSLTKSDDEADTNDDQTKSLNVPMPGTLISQSSESIADKEVPLPADLHSTSTTSSPALNPVDGPPRSSHSVASSQTSGLPRAMKQLLFIDRILVQLSLDRGVASDSKPDQRRRHSQANDRPEISTMSASSVLNMIPGAFTTTDGRECHTPQRSPPQARVNARRNTHSEPKNTGTEPQSTCITVNSVNVQFDLSIVRLAINVTDHMLSSMKGSDSVSRKSQSKPSVEPTQSPDIKVEIKNTSILFVDRVREHAVISDALNELESIVAGATEDDVLLAIHMGGLLFKRSEKASVVNTVVDINKFSFGYAHADILNFDSSLSLKDSQWNLLSSGGKDISLSITQSADSCRYDLVTLPLHLSLDLQKLDETFGWFGGLSSVLELGSSIASTATPKGPPSTTVSAARQQTRTVRFSEPSHDVDRPVQANRTKINVRIGGLMVDIIGTSGLINVETTGVKVVGRGEIIGMSVGKARISPHFPHHQHSSCMSTVVESIRLDYLSAPEEIDLTRLLSVLTPSQNRYDDNDDIMLDTLLRQRRKGPVIRLALAALKTNITNVDDLKKLPSFAADLGKLSTVAKYLPEDDRPGILTLLLVKQLEVKAGMKDTFGDIKLNAENFEIAHVGIPPLLAMQIENISLHRNVEEELIGEVLPPKAGSPRTRSPMVMIRFIGDEMEPTVKIKLQNFRFEYRMQLITALMAASQTPTPEELVTKMADSIITVTDAKPQSPIPSIRSPTSSDNSAMSTKRPKVLVAIQDSAIALNHSTNTSKGLLVLSDAKILCAILNDDDLEASLEIKKASFLAINDTGVLGSMETVARRRSLDLRSSQVQELCDLGYVSLGYISSAYAATRITQTKGSEKKCVDLEIKDDLFVLETCADSTQTMISILTSLAPPSPPSKDLAYRTEIVPIQDMLSSFSGNAFAAPEGPNVITQPLDLDEGDLMDDDIPQNLEFVSSFYKPEPNDSSDADDMLEGDLCELANPPATRNIGDSKLLKSFQEQYEIAPGEALNFQDDHFKAQSSVGGTAHRWNAMEGTYSLSNENLVKESPIRIRVRDVHFIWNLFDGYDWQSTRDTISKVVKEVEVKAIEKKARRERRMSWEDVEEESVIGDFLFNSVYIGIPANRDPRELTRQINRDIDDLASETDTFAPSTVSRSPSRRSQPQSARVKGKKLRLSRSKHHKMAIELQGVSADIIIFPPNAGEVQNSIDVRVRDLHIFDHVPTSTWKTFVSYMKDVGERETGTSMVHLELLNVKPVADLAASELVVKATILPLRLHVDQDALDFLSRFFEFKDKNVPETPPSEAPFLQRVEINSVRVKLDYKPKTVDYAGLRSGRTTEFMNFFVLDGSDMVLRHVIIYGVSGFDKLGNTLNDIWMPDIKRNQLPGVLAGLAPVRSLVNVGSGVKDLVVVPIREYKKDGRIVRSIQKGALAFAKTTTSELVKLGAKVAIGTQTVLQGAEELLNKPERGDRAEEFWEDGSVSDTEEKERKHISLYAEQPVGVVQGLRGAYTSLERDLLMARDAIVAVPGEVMDSTSAGDAAKAVLKKAPTVILRPAIGATKALGQTLLGATNSLDPENRRRMEEKYKRH